MSDKDPKEWKEQLTPEQYEVCINHGTEPPFSGKYNDSKLEGSFKCICCGEELFSSNSKFDSGSGWPSFDREIKGNVAYSTDNNLGYTRVEEHCANCGGHLGHVFNDGPIETTGKRHCINGVSLKFTPTKTSDEK